MLFIQLAKALKDIGNLNSVVGMLGGLNHGCVQRLRKTWDVVPKDHMQTFADLEAFVDSVGNYRNYRPYLVEMGKLQLPAIPYLGTPLTTHPLCGCVCACVRTGVSSCSSPHLAVLMLWLCVGVYLRDLVFMDDGIPTVKDGKPNFEKVRSRVLCVRVLPVCLRVARFDRVVLYVCVCVSYCPDRHHAQGGGGHADVLHDHS